MDIALEVLIVGDVGSDRSHLARSLHEHGLDGELEVVANAEPLAAALGQTRWDLVLCEHVPGSRDAFRALDLIRALERDVPTIILAACDDAETATLMQAGARDVIPASSVGRLALAVRREVEASRLQVRLAVDSASHRQLFRNIVEHSIQAMVVRKPSGTVFVNDTFCQMFGYAHAELMHANFPYAQLYHPDDRAKLAERARARTAGITASRRDEIRGLRKDGSVFWIEYITSDIEWQGERATQILAVDITERKNAERRILDQERKYRETFHNAPVAMFRSAPDRTVIEVNRAFEALLGYSHSEIEGMLPRNLIHPDDIAAVRERTALVWNGQAERVENEYRMRTKDGKTIWVLSSGCLVPDDAGKPNHLLVQLQDITERHQAELHFQNLVEGSIQGVMVARKGTPLFANSVAAAMFGYTVEEFLALPSTSLVYHPDERLRHAEFIASRHRGDRSIRNFVARAVRKDGSELWTEQRSSVIDWRGEPATQIVIVDITERQIAEQQLAANERKYRETFRNAPVAMVRSGRDRRIIEANPAFQTLLGYDEHELVGMMPGDLVPTAELASVTHEIKKVWEGESEKAEVEHRMRRKDGKLITVVVTANMAPDEAGQPNHLLFHFRDVTERRRAEAAVRQRELTYRGLVDNSIQGILVWSGQTLFVNEACCRMFGRKAEEFLGRDDILAFYHPDERTRLEEFARLRDQGDDSRRRFEVRGLRKDGSTFWLEQMTSVIDWNGKPALQIVMIDITERKTAEELLGSREKTYRELFENAPVAMYRAFNRKIVHVNHAFEKLLGYTEAEVLGQTRRDLMPANDASQTPHFGDLSASSADNPAIEHRMIRKDGTEIWVNTSYSVIPGDGGPARDMIVHLLDVTARRDAEYEAKKREVQYRHLVEESLQGVAIAMIGGKLLFANGVFSRMYGYSTEEILSLDSTIELYHRGEWPRIKSFIASRAEGDDAVRRYEIRSVRKDGSVFWTEQMTSAVDWYGQSATQIVSIDITERKLAEFELQERELRYRNLVDNSIQGIVVMTDKTLFVNDAHCRMFGYTPEEFVALPSVYACYHPDDRPMLRDFAEKRRQGDKTRRSFEVRGVRKDGSVFWLAQMSSTIEWQGVTATQVVTIDITERKHAEQLLSDSEKQFRELFDKAPVAMAWVSPEGRYVRTNPALQQMLGYSAEEFLQMNPLDTLHPKSREEAERSMMEMVRGGADGLVRENQHIRKDGRTIWTLVTVRVVRDENGQTRYVLAQLQDITARKTAEEQLFQSQKMEALGNLAGGIAHDFNNMLLPIMALTEITKGELPADSPVQENLSTVLEAAHRASQLVQQILTFSRQNEREVEPFDISRCIFEATRLLRNVLPSSITIANKIESDVGIVAADRAQLHSVIMNLGSNAADAMEGKVGVLSIGLSRNVIGPELASRFASLAKGEAYARISVTDSGTGMDQATMEKIFNPFFTTKPVGEGTGLGLAMVHGIIEGFQGAIDVTSELGVGTTFDIYLPLCRTDTAEPASHTVNESDLALA